MLCKEFDQLYTLIVDNSLHRLPLIARFADARVYEIEIKAFDLQVLSRHLPHIRVIDDAYSERRQAVKDMLSKTAVPAALTSLARPHSILNVADPVHK